MALLNFKFFSETLRLATEVNVVFSQKAKRLLGNDHQSPVLYLLHGLSDNHTAWLRKSSIERYVENLDVIVVMPDVHRSFYRNTHSGYRYFDYIASELPEICKAYFGVSNEREQNFVAGLSMGGYGSFKLALSHPERYAAAASFSGALDLSALAEHRDESYPEWPHIFGPDNPFTDTEDDLFHLTTTLVNSGRPIPKLFQSCGTEDYLYPANRNFLRHCRSINFPVEFREGPGAHEWSYWDSQIQEALRWFPFETLEK
ncbi:alpha/beta hydrolase [Pelagicoccus albus]|uniref:Esterase family protein n=1 Tax=Pelagicoccus albus TaxID=415222 RepID=A0A7X1B907_9BACT|nr:alpha/beta hydrolase family protein [Pelagicoccus albus]MBC2607786.1 esterase family protein [Pelagicoccus albus]